MRYHTDQAQILADTRDMIGTPLSVENCSYLFFNSITEAPVDWEIAAPANNLFLQRTYLALLEKYPPADMTFGYFIFYKNAKAVGVAICQLLNFKAEKNINHNKVEDKAETPCFLRNISRYIRDKIAKKVDFNIMTCGNFLLTGEHGFYFDPSIKPTVAFDLVKKALYRSQETYQKQNKDISLFLIKDFFEKSKKAATNLLHTGYHEFSVQPTMIMELPKTWETFDDYLAAMYSKYRVRVKRAFKKLGNIEKRPLSTTDIELYKDKMYDLYKNIANSAGFNMLTLHAAYFLGLKEALGDKFQIVGYFLEGELVAFYTLIHNHHELEAHFLGFDPTVNRSHQVYLNMLYDMVRAGIEKRVDEIVFARTALEIKSSVGAVAHDMYCYARHRHNLSNRLASSMFNYLKPAEDWKPRHPFKPLTEPT